MKNYFKELDILSKECKCMYAAAPLLNEKYPELTRGQCNDIVLDWIRERKYDERYSNVSSGY
jgi:hypothetical protein